MSWSRRPVLRLLAWASSVALLCGLVQLGAHLLGSDLLLTTPGDRGVVVLIAFGVTVFMMSRADRPAGVYGLAISERWRRHLFAGFGVSGGLVSAVVAAGLATGAVRLADDFSLLRLIRTVVDMVPTLIEAVIATLIVAGYMAGEVRLRHGPAVTVGVCSLLATAMFAGIHADSGVTQAEARTLLNGFLMCAVLVLARLVTGDVVLGGSALFGGVLVERLLRRSGSLDADFLPESNAWSAWLAPGGVPYHSPILVVALVVSAFVLAVRLRRLPERRLDETEGGGISRSFKRFYPLGHMGLFAPLDVWLVELWKARFRVGPAYVPRLLATLWLSAANTLLTLPERLLLPIVFRNVTVPDPVFIVGVHRSGTTHLHNLLSMDRRLIAPGTKDVVNPYGFRITGWLLYPLLLVAMPWKRPMDAVKLGPGTPNEEEFALSNLCGVSPIWSLRLPRRWQHYDRFCRPDRFSPGEKAIFRRRYTDFLRRLVGWSGRRPVLKNPFNTGRVALLREMYPDARFIHIYRNPLDTYASNLHLSAELFCLLEMQPGLRPEAFGEWFLEHYRTAEERFYRDAAGLPPDRVFEVAFEDLERDPIGVVRRAYERLGLGMTDATNRRLEAYVESIAGYTKNVHRPLGSEEEQRVRDAMGALMERWGYS